MDQISSCSTIPTTPTTRKPKEECDSLGSQRVFKKTSANSVLTLYLGSRDLISKRGYVEPLRGVIYIDPKFMCSQKIYGQLTLTFRYGREDEEVMGLKFCNEAVISLKQIWPKVNYDGDDVTPLQQALMDRLGQGAYPFTLEIGMLAPPSVQLIPAKKYNGAPIGTSYDIRVFMSDLTDEKFQRRTTVKLGIRLMHKIPSDLRTIEQTNPIFTSLPKTIRLRLSPKQLKFHHHKQHQGNSSGSSSSTGPQSGIIPGMPHSPPTISTVGAIGFGGEPNINNPTTMGAKTTTTSSPLKKPTTLSTAMCEKSSDKGGNTTNGSVLATSGNGSGSRSASTTGTASSTMGVVTTNEMSSSKTTDASSTSISSNATTSKMGVTSMPALKGPEGCVDKPFLWTEGRVSLKASLNKSAYGHGEKIYVTVNIKNNSRKVIRKIRVFAVQHVDVCMFSNGKFKNVVADISENHQIKPNETFNYTYEIIPIKGPTKNWIAVEGSYMNAYNGPPTNPGHSGGGAGNDGGDNETGPSSSANMYKIASSAHRGPMTVEERNVFAIYVSYYVKVKLTLSGMGGEVSLKLPFILGHVDDDESDGNESSSYKNKHGSKMMIKHQSGTTAPTSMAMTSTTAKHKANIIEEELHEEPDAISLLNDDTDVSGSSSIRHQQREEKFRHERNLLHRYKLKRDSYSRSCEDIDSLAIDSSNSGNSSHYENSNYNQNQHNINRSDNDSHCSNSNKSNNHESNISAVKVLVHRQASESND